MRGIIGSSRDYVKPQTVCASPEEIFVTHDIFLSCSKKLLEHNYCKISLYLRNFMHVLSEQRKYHDVLLSCSKILRQHKYCKISLNIAQSYACAQGVRVEQIFVTNAAYDAESTMFCRI